MYTLVNNVDDILKQSEEIVQIDRIKYVPFLAAIELTCIQTNAIIGGQLGITTLTKKFTAEQVYTIYTTNIREFCNATLTNLSAVPDSPFAKTIHVQLDLDHSSAKINVNTRLLATVHRLHSYKDINIVNLMMPVSRSGIWSGEIVKCVPEELQLIDIYRDLYSPHKLETKIAQLVADEQVLYEFIKDMIVERNTTIVGGGAHNHHMENKVSKHSIVKLILTNDISTDVGAILIGDYADAHYTALNINEPRLQFISDRSKEELTKWIVHLCEKRFPDFTRHNNSIKLIKYSLNLTTDFRLTKFGVYLFMNNGKKVPVCDIFNSSFYEMVPYVTTPTSKRVAGPYVILRFRFIDLWTCKLIYNGSPSQDTADKLLNRIKSIEKSIHALHDHVVNLLATAPFELFQLKDYAGPHMPDHIALKKLKPNNKTMDLYPSASTQ